MRSHDIVRLFEQSLVVHFSRTGELKNVSMLRLDQGITFSQNGKEIQARYHEGEAIFLIERFSNESLARTGFQSLQGIIRRYTRYRRCASLIKAIVKWLIAPLVLATLALAINMVATRSVGEKTEKTGLLESAPIGPLSENLRNLQQPGASASPLEIPQIQLAKALAEGVKSGKYTVQLSKGSKGTLYVFSDPSCPHCQALEPELDQLAKDYTIYLFPVTVIGGDMLSHRILKLLCAKPDTRAALWKKIVRGDDPQGAECADGTSAIAANNQFFRVMHFTGTPTIINAAGETTPNSIPNTADAIRQWLTSSPDRISREDSR